MQEVISQKSAADLKASIRGDVIIPGDERYDEARKVYNAMIDRRPAVIVRCTSVADVLAAVKTAHKEGIRISVRGGGHSVPGFGTADDALVVDLGRMKGIRVDPASRTVRADGGCTWGDLYHATYPFRMAVSGGIISTTGIGGLTLGGGTGYLTRSAGLTLDNLISADVILANGDFVNASERENPDLFWALRGGSGNFGIVTNFEYRLHPVSDIVAGPMFFEVDDAPAVMRAFDDYIGKAPRELGAFFGWHIAPPLPFIPKERHGDTLCAIIACWNGPADQAKAALAPLREAAPLVAEGVGPMPFPALNSTFDPLLPPGLQHYWKSVFAKDLTEGAIEAHMKFGPKVPVVNSAMHIYPINGAVHDVAPDATAFGHRDSKYAVVIAGMWPEPSQNDANIQWVKDYYKALVPHSDEGGYINFAAGDEGDRLGANYGRNHSRLRELKAKYDPSNFFRINQNIAPAER